MTLIAASSTITSTHERARARLEEVGEILEEVSREIYTHPELAFEEHRAVRVVAATLAAAGFDTDVGCYGLPTALRSDFGSGDLRVALCVEYDALPGLGHACGHNIIAAASVGAALALAAVAKDVGMRITVLGTPAEEHGGGKVLMLRRGAWDDATFSMMVHPAPVDAWPTTNVMQAVHRLTIDFSGQSAHASAVPHMGRNAGDAATLALVAVGLLRQQVEEVARFNAIITEAGAATNIIPDQSRIEVEVRHRTTSDLLQLEERVLACFKGAGIATGCGCTWRESEPLYTELVQDQWLVERFGTHLAATGRTLDPTEAQRSGGSTDMGNVSQVVPSIHPVIGLAGATGPIHTAQFAAAAGGPGAHDAIHAAALAMVWSALDLAMDKERRDEYVRRQRARQLPSEQLRS